MPPRRNFRQQYSPPRKDSARAIADATLLLHAPGFRIEDWSPERLAHAKGLSVRRAELMLVQARMKRERGA